MARPGTIPFICMANKRLPANHSPYMWIMYVDVTYKLTPERVLGMHLVPWRRSSASIGANDGRQMG